MKVLIFRKGYHKFSVFFILVLTIYSCRNAADKIRTHALQAELSSSRVHIGDEVSVRISEDVLIDSLEYSGINTANTSADRQTIRFHFLSSGTKKVRITAYTPEGKKESAFSIRVSPEEYPEELSYEVAEVLKHDKTYYTQGLEFHNGYLYESRGQYGQSALMKIDLSGGETIREIRLDQREFGEGITFKGDSLYQLTWKSGKCYIYNEELEKIGEKKIPAGEGWGLSFDGKDFLLSDGSHKIYFLDPEFSIRRISEIYAGENPLSRLNELEYARGKLYVNVYQSNRIYAVDLNRGVAESYLDLSPLRKQLENPEAEVMNGIAYLPEKDLFLITGKYWDKAFLIRIIAKQPES